MKLINRYSLTKGTMHVTERGHWVEYDDIADILKEYKELKKYRKLARELCLLASFAEKVGAISVNKSAIRKVCDRIFTLIQGE